MAIFFIIIKVTDRFVENLEGPERKAIDRKHRRWINRRGGSASLWAGSSEVIFDTPILSSEVLALPSCWPWPVTGTMTSCRIQRAEPAWRKRLLQRGCCTSSGHISIACGLFQGGLLYGLLRISSSSILDQTEEVDRQCETSHPFLPVISVC